MKEGTLFFTKNGVFLGIAFKNVIGNFYPAVGMTGKGTKIRVTFPPKKQMFDTSLLQKYLPVCIPQRSTHVSNTILNLSAEMTSLVRFLMDLSPSEKDRIYKKKEQHMEPWQALIIDCLNTNLMGLPKLSSALAQHIKSMSSTDSASVFGAFPPSEIYGMIGSLACLGMSLEVFRPLGKVHIDGFLPKDLEQRNPLLSHLGVIIDKLSQRDEYLVYVSGSTTVHSKDQSYDPLTNLAIVPADKLLPVSDEPGDPRRIDLKPSLIQALLSTIETAASVYVAQHNWTNQLAGCSHHGLLNYIRAQTMMVLFKWIALPTENSMALIQSLMEKDQLLKHIADCAFELHQDITPQRICARARTLQAHMLEECVKQVKLRGPMVIRCPHITRSSSDNNLKEEQGPPVSSPISSGYKSLRKKDKDKKSRPVIPSMALTQSPPGVGDDIEVSGTPLQWNEVKFHQYLIVTRPDHETGRSDWVSPAMDGFVGRIGAVIGVDHTSQHLLLNFYSPDTVTSTAWWFHISVLVVPTFRALHSICYHPTKYCFFNSQATQVFMRDALEDLPIMNVDQLVMQSSSHHRTVFLEYCRLLLVRLVITNRWSATVDPFLLIKMIKFGVADGPSNWNSVAMSQPTGTLASTSLASNRGESLSNVSSSSYNTTASYVLKHPTDVRLTSTPQTITAEALTQMLVYTMNPVTMSKMLTKFHVFVKQESQLHSSKESSSSSDDKQQQPIYKSGYLMKQKGKVFKGWKRYWVVLKGNRQRSEFFLYYSEKKDGIPKMLVLTAFTVQYSPELDPQLQKKMTSFPFKLMTQDKQLILHMAAYSAQEQQEWVKELQMISADVNNMKQYNHLPSEQNSSTHLANALLREVLRNLSLTKPSQSLNPPALSIPFITPAPSKNASFSDFENSSEGSDPATTTTPSQSSEPSVTASGRSMLLEESGKQSESNHVTYMVIESPHPYLMSEDPNAAPPPLIKQVHFHGAKQLLVLFDPSSDICSTDYILRFYSDARCIKPFASFTGRGFMAFPPTVIDSDVFWIWFGPENLSVPLVKGRFGFRFFVVALTDSKLSEDTITPPGNFHFGICALNWMLSCSPGWTRPLYSVHVYNSLVSHLTPFRMPLLDRRMKVLVCLTKLLSRYKEFPEDGQPDTFKLHNLKLEMFDWFFREGSFSMHSSHSKYLCCLIECLIQSELVKDWQFRKGIQPRDEQDLESSDEHVPALSLSKSLPDLNAAKKSPSASSSKTSNNAIGSSSPSRGSLSEWLEGSGSKAMTLHGNSQSNWFYRAVMAAQCLRKLLERDTFPFAFIKEAYRTSLEQVIVHESPHPYPVPSKVTSPVEIPGAEELVVSFDPRSRTRGKYDVLMFSKSQAGQSDLGIFTGVFPLEEKVIQGSKFVWSFIAENPPQQPQIQNRSWGFRLTVIPIFSAEAKAQLDARIKKEADQLASLSKGWTFAMDAELIRLINAVCEKARISSREFTVEYAVKLQILKRSTLLSNVSLESLDLRLKVLRYFNNLMSSLMPLVDMANIRQDWSLAHKVAVVSPLIFFDNKTCLMDDLLNHTACMLKRPVIFLNRQKSKEPAKGMISIVSLSHNETTFEEQPADSVFLQGFNALRNIDPLLLRQTDRAFEVKLENEGAEDAGGPYHEVMTQFCRDLLGLDEEDKVPPPSSSSGKVRLFIPTPNARAKIGSVQDKYIPNPAAVSVHHLEQFRFVGRLLGIALRTKNVLDLPLSSIVWKHLVDSKLELADLEAIDHSATQLINTVRLNGPSLDELQLYFTAESADGVHWIELRPGGAKTRVSQTSRLEFALLFEQYRLAEFQPQCEAIKKGLQDIVGPNASSLLSIFTWSEVELLVCGRPGIDLGRLVQNTVYYAPYSPHHYLIQQMWELLKSLTALDRAQFLRFVSGRSRLPPEDREFGPLLIQPLNRTGDQDQFLPEAHTCFFTLVLPVYSSGEVLKEKLLYAIHTCKEIDTDFNVNMYASETFEQPSRSLSQESLAEDESPNCISQ